MKNLNYLITVTLLLIAFSACNFEEKDWNIAKSQNTVEALEQFQAKYPKSLYADSAKQLIGKTFPIALLKGKWKIECSISTFSASRGVFTASTLSWPDNAQEEIAENPNGNFTFRLQASDSDEYLFNLKKGENQKNYLLTVDSKSPGGKTEKLINELPLNLLNNNIYFSDTTSSAKQKAIIDFSKTGQHRWKIKTEGPNFDFTFKGKIK